MQRFYSSMDPFFRLENQLHAMATRAVDIFASDNWHYRRQSTIAVVFRRGFWTPIRGPDPTPIDTHSAPNTAHRCFHGFRSTRRFMTSELVSMADPR